MANKTRGTLPFCLMACFVLRVLRCCPGALCFLGFEIPTDWRALPPMMSELLSGSPETLWCWMKKGWRPRLSTTLFLQVLLLLPGMPHSHLSLVTLSHNYPVYFTGKTLSLEIIIFVYWFTCRMSVYITFHPPLECKFQGMQTSNSISQFLGKTKQNMTNI